MNLEKSYIMATKKITVKQLREMIREAIEDTMKEISGGVSMPSSGRGYVGGSVTAPRMGAMTTEKPLDFSKLDLNQAAALMKDPELSPEKKKELKQRIMMLLKSAGW